MTGDPFSARLHVVTGKGGTGKTTVGAALALALAGSGRRVLLCEVEGRQGIASVFDVAPLPYTERRIAIGNEGGEVWALAIDAQEALREYLALFYRLGRASWALDKVGVTEFATTIAPGLRDVLLIGKVYEATRRKAGERSASGRSAYDAVVLDAPPTGRVGRFLNVNTEVAGVARVGPVRNQATSIMRLLRSPRTVVHVVTTLEEMPVQEALDTLEEIRGIGMHVGAVVVNMARPPVLSPECLAAAADGTLDLSAVAGSLDAVDLPYDDTLLESLAAQARERAERIEFEELERRRLEKCDGATVTLPYVAEGVDPGTLYDFAATLRAARTDS